MKVVAIFLLIGILQIVNSLRTAGLSCRFAKDFTCADFQSPAKVQKYLSSVMTWENKFAQPGIGYDVASGYTYDGHPLNYKTGELYDTPHLFSAPSKESIHMAILALALNDDPLALQFAGGRDNLIDVLALKIKGYKQFNESFPGFGCFTPWVQFNLTAGTFEPLPDWLHKVPGLDNGEWFWGLFAVANILSEQSKFDVRLTTLSRDYQAFVSCQITNAKTIFYQGNGNVADVVSIVDPKKIPTSDNYFVPATNGKLDDPYEGETMTQLLYLFSSWDSGAERQLLWENKRAKLQKVDYKIRDSNKKITVQQGFWFSTHEQWKTLLLPYVNNLDLPLVHKLFQNAEKARTWDAVSNHLPGLLASINDVTDGSQTIPDYASACGVPEIASQPIERRDILTPYGSFGLFLFDMPSALCWYNNMLRAPRMQSAIGSTEAINANGTEISPLTTWDSKATTVLAMLGGIGTITGRFLRQLPDNNVATTNGTTMSTKYDAFVKIVSCEYARVFESATLFGDDVSIALPQEEVPVVLSDWDLSCA
jgi:hypothetical protein